MKILGIRTSPSTVRYAILEWDGEVARFINTNGENKLDFPSGFDEVGKKLDWLYKELERIFRQTPNIDRIVIKASEYGRGGETAASRQAAYFDAIVYMSAAQRAIPCTSVLYRSIGTRRADVKTYAEEHVGPSSSHWNEQMADAIAAAWSGREG
jgi:hypothetical protein